MINLATDYIEIIILYLISMHIKVPHFKPCSDEKYLRGKGDLTYKEIANIH